MTRTKRNSSLSSFLLIAWVLSFCLACWPVHAGQSSNGPQPPAQQASAQQTEQTKTAVQVEPPPVARTPFQQEELRADLLMARKEYADAASVYEKLLAQQPRNAAILNKLGISYHQQARLDLAKKYYERAMKADRNFANAYNNLAMVYYQRKKYKKAVELCLDALRVDPQMSVGYSNLGYSYFHLKKYDEAMDAFRHALSLDPEIFERTSKGGSLLQDRTVMGDRGLFNFFLAKSFAARGDAAQCARYLKRAIDEGYKNVLSARTDVSFKPVLKDPTVRELLQLEPLPPEPKTNIAPTLRP